jgi:small subunit ribosomal protein S9
LVTGIFKATGRRKTAIARVWIKPGDGKVVTVNRRPFENFFPNPNVRQDILMPLEVTGTAGQFDVSINVSGGGIYGQADAIRLGLARALVIYNEDFKAALRKSGLLTRDPRMKERKKYGQRGARARFQFSKR